MLYMALCGEWYFKSSGFGLLWWQGKPRTVGRSGMRRHTAALTACSDRSATVVSCHAKRSEHAELPRSVGKPTQLVVYY
jgi:hypothetical protein